MLINLSLSLSQKPADLLLQVRSAAWDHFPTIINPVDKSSLPCAFPPVSGSPSSREI